jgi:hypothetical protein
LASWLDSSGETLRFAHWLAYSAAARVLPNKRLKLPARIDYGMSLSSARRSLGAIRYAAHDLKQNRWLVH